MMHESANAAPSAQAERLDAALQALGLAAEPRQREQLLAYVELLQRWNRVYNLTAVRDPQQMLTLHLLDCLALLPVLDARAPRRLLDVGSGAGLPGLVIAIMRPGTRVVLNDAVQKKCAFLQQAVATLRLDNVQVVHGRVEQLALPPFDCISCRAFADLATIVSLTRHLLAPDGCWAAMKGVTPADEIAALPAGFNATVQPLQVPGLDAQRCVVWLTPPSSAHSAP